MTGDYDGGRLGLSREDSKLLRRILDEGLPRYPRLDSLEADIHRLVALEQKRTRTHKRNESKAAAHRDLLSKAARQLAEAVGRLERELGQPETKSFVEPYALRIFSTPKAWNGWRRKLVALRRSLAAPRPLSLNPLDAEKGVGRPRAMDKWNITRRVLAVLAPHDFRPAGKRGAQILQVVFRACLNENVAESTTRRQIASVRAVQRS